MTDAEIQHVRLLIAQGRAESLKRQNEELDRFFNVAIEIANFWRSFAPEGTEYPEELKRKITELDPGRSGEKPK